MNANTPLNYLQQKARLITIHMQAHKIGWYVFLSAFCFYFFMAYFIAAKTTASAHGQDCIFSLDTSKLIRMVLYGERIDYVYAFHPLSVPIARIALEFFSIFTSNPYIALAAFQALCAALSVTFFYLILHRLALRRSIVAGSTLLFATCFSTMIYAVYFDAPVFLGTALIISAYAMLRRPEAMSKPYMSGALFIAAVSGLIIGAIQHGAFLLTHSHTIRDFIKGVLAAVVALFVLLMAVLIASASGWMQSDLLRAFQSNYGFHYNYVNAYNITVGEPANIHTLKEYLLFTLHNLFSVKKYLEIVMGMFIIPVVTLPIRFNIPMVDHNCTWFEISFADFRAWMGLLLFALAVIGAVQAFRAKQRFYYAILLSLLGSVLFYGFAYTTLFAYLYSVQFIFLYFILIALGAEASLKWLAIHAPTWVNTLSHGVFVLVLCAILINNLDQWNILTDFMFNRFRIR